MRGWNSLFYKPYCKYLQINKALLWLICQPLTACKSHGSISEKQCFSFRKIIILAERTQFVFSHEVCKRNVVCHQLKPKNCRCKATWSFSSLWLLYRIGLRSLCRNTLSIFSHIFSGSTQQRLKLTAVFSSVLFFITQNLYLSVQNSARFPPRVLAAERCVQPVCDRKNQNFTPIFVFLCGYFTDLDCGYFAEFDCGYFVEFLAAHNSG